MMVLILNANSTDCEAVAATGVVPAYVLREATEVIGAKRGVGIERPRPIVAVSAIGRQ